MKVEEVVEDKVEDEQVVVVEESKMTEEQIEKEKEKAARWIQLKHKDKAFKRML